MRRGHPANAPSPWPRPIATCPPSPATPKCPPHGGAVAFVASASECLSVMNGFGKAPLNALLSTAVFEVNAPSVEEFLLRCHLQSEGFIDACFMVTPAGAAVSDEVADGRVVSGV